MLSFVLSVYGFAIGYLYIAAREIPMRSTDARACNCSDAVYLSTYTADDEVGYGDIAPTSPHARLLAIGQMSLSLLYVTFLFSIVASAVRTEQPKSEDREDGEKGATSS